MSEKNLTPAAETGESFRSCCRSAGTSWMRWCRPAGTPIRSPATMSRAHAQEILDGFESGFEGRTVSIAGVSWPGGIWGRPTSSTCRTAAAGSRCMCGSTRSARRLCRVPEVGPWGHRRRPGRGVPHPPGRDLGAGRWHHPALQEPAPAAGEVARPQGHRRPLPPALSGPDGQPRGEEDLPCPVEVHPLPALLSGRAGLHRGGRPRCSTPSSAVRRPGRLSPTTTRWTSICTCASPPSCPSSG